MGNRKDYGTYKRGDVVYVDFGSKPHGVEGGIRPGVIVSCDASNHSGAPMVTVCPLSSKLKDIPVHVQIKPEDGTQGSGAFDVDVNGWEETEDIYLPL